MRLRLAVFFLLWSGFAALGLGTPGVPPFFGASAGVPAIPSIFDQVASVGAQAVCWSFRACATAVAGNKLANICNASDVTCVDMLSSATTGNLVLTTVGGTNCAVSTCTVKTLYEQETCGATCNMTQATIANRPVFVPSCTPNGHACMTCASANSQSLTTVGNVPSITQAFSVASLAKRTGTATGILWGGSTNNSWSENFFGNSANQFSIYSGTTQTVTAADNAFHSLIAVHTGASSSATVDGSTTSSLNIGTNNFSATLGASICNSFFGPLFNGSVAEIGVFGSGVTLTGTQITNLYNNQHNYW